MIRILRVLEYRYEDAEAMAVDMAHWTIGANAVERHGKTTISSSTHIPGIVEPTTTSPDDETLNRLAQVFYEASGIQLGSMADKPLVVQGLQAVFAAVTQ